MKILSADQIKALDQYTIENEPITSIKLMERASRTFSIWFLENFKDCHIPLYIFCGPGNNGGDGLAIARLLEKAFFNIHLFVLNIGNEKSPDFLLNLKKIPKRTGISCLTINKNDELPEIPDGVIIIDAIFGSGLNRPVEGFWATVIQHINNSKSAKVAVDIPSGIFADRHSNGLAFKADYTFSFEMPKLAFMFPENGPYVGEWHCRSIGLAQSFITQCDVSVYYLTENIVKYRFKKRAKFSHKGHYGHALLICGSKGMIGAAMLASKACLRTGAGLLTSHIPSSGNDLMQISIPEAMLSLDKHSDHCSGLPELSKYNAIGAGCGLGQAKASARMIENLLKSAEVPLVLDADALNLIAEHQLSAHIPEGSILTPHQKEFERLFGKAANDFERFEVQRKMAIELGVYIILKNAHTCIACPDKTVYFNSTGNPGMATAGSGDVLTGMITSLLAQGYTAKDAAICGVYLHGLAGDFAAGKYSQQAMTSGDIINHLGDGFLNLMKK